MSAVAMTSAEVVSLFPDAKSSGRGTWTARCRAHEDRHPSLSIRAARGKTLVKCMAGCSVEAVVDAVGLSVADLFEDDTAARRHVVAEYDYTDERGTLLYQVVRYEPKDFRARRPAGSGRWIWNLEGVEPVLFHLKALAGKQAIVIVEGEKDVLTAERWGYVATCNHGGAGKWKDSHTEQLRRAGCQRVMIIPDSDARGYAHAETVARACLSAGLRVAVVPLDTGKDLTAYVSAGKRPDDLAALLASSPDFDIAALNTMIHANDIDDRNDRTSATDRDWSYRSYMSYRSGGAPTLDSAALVGLPGELIRIIAPHTEGDPAALLVMTLVMAGSAIGRGPGFAVGADVHRTNLFAIVVGPTSSGRKGTSLSEVRRVMANADPDWTRDCMTAGLSSGEGLIHGVRDPVEVEEPVRDGRRVVGYQTVVRDHGVSDKRSFVTEAEFSSVLRAARRDGCTLSGTVRQAWDSGSLRVMTKSSPERATNAHISIVGHITPEELVREMSGTDLANGFANRFLFAWSQRKHLLPLGGQVDPMALSGLSSAFGNAFARARTVDLLTWDAAAQIRWMSVYESLSTDRPGLAGAVTARGPSQVIRMALIYALLDQSPMIALEHLNAALAVWSYCEATAVMVFGQRVGHVLGDYLLSLIRETPGGITRTMIRDALGRNKSAARLMVPWTC